MTYTRPVEAGHSGYATRLVSVALWPRPLAVRLKPDTLAMTYTGRVEAGHSGHATRLVSVALCPC